MQLQQIENGRRIFPQQRLAQRVVAGLHNFLQVLDHAIADSRQLFQLFRFLDELLDGFRQAIDQFRGLLIAAITADDGAVNFEELRRFAQYAGNLFVVHAGDYRAIPRRKKGEGHSIPFGISCSSRRRKSVEISPECEASNRYFLCKFEQSSLNRIHSLPTRPSRLRQPILATLLFWGAAARTSSAGSPPPRQPWALSRQRQSTTLLQQHAIVVPCRLLCPEMLLRLHAGSTLESLNPSGGSQ